jgi:hypothetical protein
MQSETEERNAPDRRRRGDQPVFRIGGREVAGDDPQFQRHLEGAYRSNGARPRCLCTEAGAEMYVAKVGGRFLIKRMPGQGGEHDPLCATYEPPAELSGLGQVLGTAITEDPIEGTTSLRLDFALTKVGRRAPAMSESEETDSAKTSGTKLSLRGLLHFLWTEAEFNKWSPGMEGKRNWGVIRRYLLSAVETKHTKGVMLSEALYIPEPWNEPQKNDIAARRRARFIRVAAANSGRRQLMLLIGEVKEFGPARYGHRIVVKHAPDCEFGVDDELAKAIGRRFETELQFLAQAQAHDEEHKGRRDPNAGHLVICGTFSVNQAGRASLEEVVLMHTNRNWIPVDDVFEQELVEQLMPAHRFTKGLRLNLPRSKPLACAVTPDTLPKPTALYIVRPGAGEAYVRTLDEMVEASSLESWIWRPAEGEMPKLPVRSPGSRAYGSGRFARGPARPDDAPPATPAATETPPEPPAIQEPAPATESPLDLQTDEGAPWEDPESVQAELAAAS